ncbi:MAG: pilus assembly protein N-terminal domain-containing protein [Bryobacteraceae bacterium]
MRLFVAGLFAAALALGVVTQPPAEEISLAAGGSAVIDYPEDIGRISTSSPEIVDAVAVSRREVLLQAKSYGVSTIVIWSKNGRRSFYRATVAFNLEPVRKLLADSFPAEKIDVRAMRDSLSLSGCVSSQPVSDRAAALVAPFAKSVVNNLRVTTEIEKQILLRVRFAELDRSASVNLGGSLISTGALNTVGSVTTGQFASASLDKIESSGNGQASSEFSISDTLNVFAFLPDLNLAAVIKALQGRGVLQILAEPNLVTTNNKEASFLAGGEFPVPVVQGGGNNNAVTVQFREFGVRLSFLPVVTPHNTIKLHVKPEVSSLDYTNGVTLSGFTIPALSMRRMETDVELRPGQSFVIAGLIDDRVTETMQKIPGLAHIPVLGTFFKSKSESKTKTELVVLVTPEITDMQSAARPSTGPAMPLEFLPPQTKDGARSKSVGK